MMVEASFTHTLQLTLTYLHCIQAGHRKLGNIAIVISL